MSSITPGQARERCFICNCWVRAATDPTVITDASAEDPERIYKATSFKFAVPSPNSPRTHRDAEPSHIPGQEGTLGLGTGWVGHGVKTIANPSSGGEHWPYQGKGKQKGCLLWRPGGTAGQIPQHLSSQPGHFFKYNYTLPSISPTDAAQVCAGFLSLSSCPSYPPHQ